MIKIKSPHVVINAKTQSIECEHCGKSEKLQLPMEIKAACRWMNGFEMMHRDCRKKEAA